jgi:hypothetical protein
MVLTDERGGTFLIWNLKQFLPQVELGIVQLMCAFSAMTPQRTARIKKAKNRGKKIDAEFIIFSTSL